MTDSLHALRHSSSHLLASAVLNLFPGTKLGNGPAIENGFYYDFDSEHTFTPEDLIQIESEMKRIANQNLEFKCEVVDRNEAVSRLSQMGQDYKLQTLAEIPPDEKITFYAHGNFQDLCEGPHIENSQQLAAFKLTRIAGAYWKGSEKNKMLQRIYGLAFPTVSELDQYLQQLEDAKKRDHRVLGKQLNLFSFHEESPANVFLHPKGYSVYQSLIDYARFENLARQYQEVQTPLILSSELWKKSGHWDHYQQNMYTTSADDVPLAVKPMNCPGACLYYGTHLYSYRDLPLRISEFGRVHRYEKSGVTHGLFRVRSFVQDDAHLYCQVSQIQTEVVGIISQLRKMYKVFGFEDLVLELSTQPEKSIGSDQIWEQATEALKAALGAVGLDYKVNPGDGAFYGPKIDFHIKDSLLRSWQCGTIQLDFSMPERFGLRYIGEDGKDHVPVMIHRAIYGSIERFFGILIEHYAGAFPFWLAPTQLKLLPLSDEWVGEAEKWKSKFSAYRVEIDRSSEKLGYKIRMAQAEKVPYMLVFGKKEMENGTLSVRHRTKGDLGQFDESKIHEILRAEFNPFEK